MDTPLYKLKTAPLPAGHILPCENPENIPTSLPDLQ
jgi:hypothetical protein